MKTKKYLIIILSLMTSTLAIAKMDSFKGEAKNSEGEVVYYEDHQVSYDEDGLVKQITTKYLRPDKEKVFAKLQSTFEDEKFVPNTKFEDYRHKKIETTKVDKKNNKLIIKHSYEDNDKTKENDLELSKNMVLGQGYHNYILTHFNDFTKENKRTLSFVVPAKRDYYEFKLSYLGEDKEDTKSFRLDIGNWFLKLFADHIEVDYDTKTKRLMAYRGLTNILDDEGDNQSLNISYTYPKDKK